MRIAVERIDDDLHKQVWEYELWLGNTWSPEPKLVLNRYLPMSRNTKRHGWKADFDTRWTRQPSNWADRQRMKDRVPPEPADVKEEAAQKAIEWFVAKLKGE